MQLFSELRGFPCDVVWDTIFSYILSQFQYQRFDGLCYGAGSVGVLGLILFSMFRFALSGCFTELFTLRDVIESYHTDEEVAVPPECNVSRVFPAKVLFLFAH